MGTPLSDWKVSSNLLQKSKRALRDMWLPETAVPPIALRLFRSLKAVGKYNVLANISVFRMVKPAFQKIAEFSGRKKTGMGRANSFDEIKFSERTFSKGGKQKYSFIFKEF